MILTTAHSIQGAPPLVSAGTQAKMSYVKPREADFKAVPPQWQPRVLVHSH